MTFTEYINYFGLLASEHKDIGHTPDDKHFYRLDMDELFDGFRSDVRFPAMILENYQGALHDGFSHNGLEMQTGAFSILDFVPPGDTEAAVAVLESTRAIALQVVSRMIKDHHEGTFPLLSIDSMEYHKVGPVFDNCYGWRVQFDFTDIAPLNYNPQNWI